MTRQRAAGGRYAAGASPAPCPWGHPRTGDNALVMNQGPDRAASVVCRHCRSVRQRAERRLMTLAEAYAANPHWLRMRCCDDHRTATARVVRE